ncbi:hypothetical protein CQ011_16305 [Arthrobacter sp. MYb213]|nr:hypothetical protein CQ011_16305 [Arthrobacter sp. MYb213]
MPEGNAYQFTGCWQAAQQPCLLFHVKSSQHLHAFATGSLISEFTRNDINCAKFKVAEETVQRALKIENW